MMRVSNSHLRLMEAEIDTSPAPFAGRDQEWTELVYDLRDERAENARLKEHITELEGRSGYCAECERLARKVEELEGQLAGAREDAEKAISFDRLLIAGNHLAVWLMAKLGPGERFLPYETDFSEACNQLPPDAYDVWIAWAVAMRERDRIEAAIAARKKEA